MIVNMSGDSFMDVVVYGWISFYLIASVFLLKYEMKIPAEMKVWVGLVVWRLEERKIKIK